MQITLFSSFKFNFSLVMGKRKQTPISDTIFTVKLLQVSTELSLWEVVREIQTKIRTIIAIHRVYDFMLHLKCDEIFVCLRDKVEYEALKEMGSILILGSPVNLEFKEFNVGAAIRPRYVTIAPAAEISKSPISMQIKKLTEVSIISSIYVRKLLHTFESLERDHVTGVNLVYDTNRNSIRPFGFICFANLRAMLNFHCRVVEVDENEKLYCEGSYRVPVIVSEQNKEMIDTKPIPFNQDLCDANLLSGFAILRPNNNEQQAAARAGLAFEPDSNSDNTVGDPCDDDADSVLSLDLDTDFEQQLEKL